MKSSSVSSPVGQWPPMSVSGKKMPDIPICRSQTVSIRISCQLLQ